MSVLFLEYPKCSTCQKAKAWLIANNVEFVDRHIVTDNPTAVELDKWLQISNLPIKKFFNTSGLVYKDLGLKDKLADMDRAEQIKLLSTNGMLVKRPIIIAEDFVLLGFKEEQWQRLRP